MKKLLLLLALSACEVDRLYFPKSEYRFGKYVSVEVGMFACGKEYLVYVSPSEIDEFVFKCSLTNHCNNDALPSYLIDKSEPVLRCIKKK
jgi:hypothetical protein